ncbi:hypothetical protein ABDJ41_15135 [Pedobacter sp. ASV1-7]|uniref:hypothetical protein n=1 Tax=Pedobacter sp. ASV1-7 TaxID=3145237 RepID=UPI0032E8DDB8
MTAEQQTQLQEKRVQLQIRIRFKEFLKEYITSFLEILDEFQNLEIEYRVLSFRCIPEEFHDLLRENLQIKALVKYQLAQVEITAEDLRFAAILEKYPSANPFRYVLDAPVGYNSQPGEVLQEIMKTHRISEEIVVICWLKYAFLLEININDLAQKTNTGIINTWHGDTIIFPKDYRWLIAYSLEDEWRFKS